MAVVGVAGLLFAACGSASGSEGAHAVITRPRQDASATAPSAADADTLWHYLDTLEPRARAQTIIALNPKVRDALEAVVASNIATTTGYR